MTPEERLELEKKVAKLLAKSQREFERALKEAHSTRLLKLPLIGFKRRAYSSRQTDHLAGARGGQDQELKRSSSNGVTGS